MNLKRLGYREAERKFVPLALPDSIRELHYWQRRQTAVRGLLATAELEHDEAAIIQHQHKLKELEEILDLMRQDVANLMSKR